MGSWGGTPRRRCRQGLKLKEEFGRWVGMGETIQVEEVGEGLVLGRVRRHCCQMVKIAGS